LTPAACTLLYKAAMRAERRARADLAHDVRAALAADKKQFKDYVTKLDPET
jgi:hypothetical protein